MAQDLDAIRAEQLLRKAAMVDEALPLSLSAEIAVIDGAGLILAANPAWKHFTETTDLVAFRNPRVGDNYLDACRLSESEGFPEAARILEGLTAVLRKTANQYVLECELPPNEGTRWLSLTATSLAQMPGALISVRDVTELKKARDVLGPGDPANRARPHLDLLLPALVQQVATSANTRHALLGELLEGPERRLRVLSHWAGTDYGPLFEYDLAGTPCEQVMLGQACAFPRGLQKLFPEDLWLQEIKAESYVAIPLLGSEGQILGELAVIDTQPMTDTPLIETVLRLFAFSITPELERRRTEIRLADHWRLIESAPVAVVGTDPSFTITYWNHAAERIFGWKAHEVIGRNSDEVLQTEASSERLQGARRRVVETGEFRSEGFQHHRDGTPIYIDLTAIGLRDHLDNVRGFVFAIHDITRQKQAEQALHAAEVKAKSLLEAIPDMTFTIDGSGRILSFTPAANFDPLLPPSEFIGKLLTEVLPRDISPAMTSAIESCLRSEQVQVHEYQLVESDGLRYYEARYVKVGPDEVMAIVRDYTAQRREQKASRQQTAPEANGAGTPLLKSRAKTRARVLVVDQDVHLLRFLKRILEQSGKEVLLAGTSGEALRLLDLEQPDLILLDISLAGASTNLFADMLRLSKAPVVAFATQSDESDAIACLSQGAADYITKPVYPAALIGRVDAVLRRSNVAAKTESRLYQFGELSIDPGAHTVTLHGEVVRLTATEYRLLLELAESAGRVITHEQILEDVWGTGYASQQDLLRSFIRSLRQKIGDTTQPPKLILTERGIGYRMVRED